MVKPKIKVLEEICQEESNCAPNKYCILKELISHDAKFSNRLLFQMAMIDKFKYEKSAELKKDLGWLGALESWTSEGYAKKFDKYFDEDINFKELYKKIMEDK